MKTLHYPIIATMVICFIMPTNAYACTYCPAIPSSYVPQQQEIPSIILEVIIIGSVIGSWIAIFGLFKENNS